jgi:hypothetical protein
MLSDPRVTLAFEALAQPIAEFRAAVEGAAAQADAYLSAQQADPAARAAHAAAELGAFAAGRIDAARFAALFPVAGHGSAEARAALARALDTLRTMESRGPELFLAEVTADRRLGATVDTALAAAGRAFSAIIVAELVRGERYRAAEHDKLLDAFEFRAWNKAERRFAPPLVVALDGAELHAGALLDFADGREKIVLVVRGECAPASLVRCITPGTFVLQTVDGSGLDRVASFDGPAIAAIVPEGAAVFMHDPGAGNEPWQRLSIRHLPAAPKKPVGDQSAWQMTQDLQMLADLARTPFAVPAAGGAPASPALGAHETLDRLANWLVDQSGLAAGG